MSCIRIPGEWKIVNKIVTKKPILDKLLSYEGYFYEQKRVIEMAIDLNKPRGHLLYV